MNVLIVNAYDRHNAGDAALLSALVGQVHRAFPEADVSFAGLEDPQVYPEFEGTRNVGSIRRWVGDMTVGRPRRIGRKVLAVGLALTPPLGLRWLSGASVGLGTSDAAGELRTIAEADLVVGLGGGYLNGSASLAGTLNVFFVLLPLWLAVRLHKPTVLAPQSYGPFGGRFQKLLVRTCLNRTDRIVVREDISLALLRSAGVHARMLQRGIDSAFDVTDSADTAPPARDDGHHPDVAITARSWLPDPAQESYERSLALFADWLHQARGASVTFVPQVTSDYQGDDDRLVSRRVASYCATAPTVIEERLSHVALRSIYRRFDYVIGTRFHSVIFSLTGGTPALAIEYEHKTSGIMRDLGLGDWVIPMDDVTAAALGERFSALETARPDYERRLQEQLPRYQERAGDFVHILRRSVP